MDPVNQGIDERLFSFIVETNRQAPFYQTIDMRTRALGPGYAELAILVRKLHTNPLGMAHGGLISTIADAAMGNAIRTTGRTAVTVDYSICFLSPAPLDSEIIGRGEVVREGNHLVFVKATLACKERIIATSQGTFFVVGEINLA